MQREDEISANLRLIGTHLLIDLLLEELEAGLEALDGSHLWQKMD